MTDDMQLRRDPQPVLVCACSHIEAEHDCHGKTKAALQRPCGCGGCGCLIFRCVERRWRVHGWIAEKIAG